jgi:hypothetical protein
VVVLPQLTRELGELGVVAAGTPMSDVERGSSS